VAEATGEEGKEAMTNEDDDARVWLAKLEARHAQRKAAEKAERERWERIRAERIEP
jgi:hypothetical protein